MSRQEAAFRSTTARRLVQPESSLQRQVLALAKAYGWRAYHSWSSQHSTAGFPDLVLLRPPRLIFAELKRQDRNLSDDQAAWAEDLVAAGVEYYLWRPADFQAIEEILRRRRLR
jgi:hypothetical protein